MLSFANLVAAMDRHVVSLLLGPIQDSLGLSDTQLGLLQGPGFAVLYAVAMLLTGFVIGRVDRVRLVLAGTAVWSFGMLGLALAPDFHLLFAARVLVGAGQGVLVPAALSLLADHLPFQARGRAVGLFTACGAAGRGVSLIAGAAALAWATSRLDLADPWRGTALLLLLPNLLMAAALFLHPRDRFHRDGARSNERSDVVYALSWLWQHRLLCLGIVIANAVSVLLVQTMASWAPLLMLRTSGWTLSEIGWITGLVSLAGAGAGNLLGGWLTDIARSRCAARGPALAIAAPFAMATVMAGLFCFASSSTLAAAGLFGFNLFAGMAIPASLAALQQMRAMRAPGLSITMMLALSTLVGGALGPFSVGALADMFSALGEPLSWALFMSLGAAAVMGAIIIWRTGAS